MVYNPVWEGQRHTFGVSGLLYKRNLLLYDRETESLWSQLGGSAVTGDLAGTLLQLLPVTQTTWARWKNEHPRTVVLSFNTGFRRDYSKDPYGDWPMDRRLAVVVEINRSTKIYPFSELKKVGTSLTDDIVGMKVIGILRPSLCADRMASSFRISLPSSRTLERSIPMHRS